MNAAEGVTWLLQMAREMSIEAQQWKFFAVTWKALGFPFNEALHKRLRAHATMLEHFMADAKHELVPKAATLGAAELSRWTTKLGKLQKTHGDLVAQFRDEASDFEDAKAPFRGRSDHL
jgi:hypothetical protein